MSVFPTSTQISTLSSLPTQPQHLKNSDLRIAPATPAQRQYIRDLGVLQAKRELEAYVTHNEFIKRMNQVTHHHRKCVTALDSSNSSTGSAAWFMQLWNQLSFDDELDFQSKIEEMLGVRPHDFCVDVTRRSECPVIFFLFSILNPLVERTFKRIQLSPANGYPEHVSVWQQAFTVLHNPSAHKEQYRDFLSEAYDLPTNHRSLMMPLSTSTKLSTLSSLLTQLQDLNNSDLRLPSDPIDFDSD